MNYWFVTAAVMMGLTVLLHVFGGGPEIHVPIQASELSDYLRAISAVLWHAVTVILLVFTLGYVWAVAVGRTAAASVVVLMALAQVGFAGVFLFYGFAILGSPWPMPQWVIFLVITAVSLMGMRRAGVRDAMFEEA